MRCLVRFSQIGGTEDLIAFSLLSEVLSLQITSDFASDFDLAVYIPANVITNAPAMIHPILVLISVVFDIYDEDILEMLHQRLINVENCWEIYPFL